MTMRYVKHGDVEIAYQVREPEGRPDAPTLLLIMGIDLRSAHWGEQFVGPLAEHYRVVMFDNRGTGHSTKRVAEIDVDVWAEDALTVLDELGIERAYVLGYSMGGRIAQQLAVFHPERVERLVLLASTVGGKVGVTPLPEAMAAFVPIPGASADQLRRRSFTVFTGPGFETTHPERFEELLTISAEKATHPSIVQRQINVLRDDVVAKLPAVKIPTLIIHGDADTLVPFGNGEALRKLMPSAEMLRLEGIGHLPTWEAPEALVDAMRRFLG